MSSFREYSRVFFSIFLILTSFIGCCQSVTWMSELSNVSYERNTYRVNERYHPQEKEEEVEENVDTVQTTSEKDEYEDYYERHYMNSYPY